MLSWCFQLHIILKYDILHIFIYVLMVEEGSYWNNFDKTYACCLRFNLSDG